MILDYFPEADIRPGQEYILREIERQFNHYDVFVVRGPTAIGKTAIEVCIARWRAAHNKTATVLYPTNVLVEQTHAKYPDLTRFSRKAAYRCEDFDRDCETTEEACGKVCYECPYKDAKKEVKTSKARIMNYHTYWAHKLYTDTIICDESHSIVNMLDGQQGIKLWRGKYHFPMDLKTTADVLVWAQEYLSRYNDKKLAKAVQEIIKIRAASLVQYDRSTWRGQESIVLHVVPTSARGVPPWLWPSGKVNKIVMLSATTGPHDIYELALEGRRVLYIDVDSPIPAANRPVVYRPVANMAHRYLDISLPLIAKEISKILLEFPKQKGLIHVPYGLALRLQDLLDEPRLLWHTKETKQEALKAFRESPPDSGQVLVASGLYEGVDLPYECAWWQIIVKVPFLSLGDARIKHKAEQSPEWYAWETVKRVLQACGRIVRHPDDRGITFILDSLYKPLYDRNPKMFPKFFKDASQF